MNSYDIMICMFLQILDSITQTWNITELDIAPYKGCFKVRYVVVIFLRGNIAACKFLLRREKHHCSLELSGCSFSDFCVLSSLKMIYCQVINMQFDLTLGCHVDFGACLLHVWLCVCLFIS